RTNSHVAWLSDTSKVPTVADITQATNPTTGRKWIVAEQFQSLRSPKPPGIEPPGWRQRHLWFRTTGVIVAAKRSAALVRWLNRELKRPSNDWGRMLDEAPESCGCFLGEFSASRAFEAESSSYHGRGIHRPRGASAPDLIYSLVADG